MNWRRGLVFAAIHLVIAGTLMWWEFALRDATQKRWSGPAGITGVVLAAQEEQTVSFNPGGMWSQYSYEDHVFIGLDLPAVIVAGNTDPCPAAWTISALIQSPGKPYTRRHFVELAIAFVALVGLQWFLVGSFPLRKPRRWWGEPGAFITACGCIGAGPLVVFAAAALIALRVTGQLWHLPEGLGILAEFAGLMAMFAWFWWFGLLLGRLAAGGWRLVLRVRVRAA